MLLDGESGGPYHKWQLTTPVLRKELEETGLFQVDVVTAPPAGGDFSAFHPDFASMQWWCGTTMRPMSAGRRS